MERFLLRREDCALLLVDLQERLLPAVHDGEGVLRRCAMAAEGCRALGVPMLATQQYTRGLGPTASPLREMIDGGHIEKLHFDCCREGSFLPALEALGRRKVVLCGLEAHICVLQTCLGLLGEGYAVHVLADAVSSRDPANRDLALMTMRDAGAVLSNVETALFQMLGEARGDEFKRISALVR